jgi:hypothetical protein
MTETACRKPAPLALKPGLEEAARRWEAYYGGEIIDRPMVCVTAPKAGALQPPRGSTYHERVHGDLDACMDRALAIAEATWFGGEAMPSFWLSFGCDEVAAFCGGELFWDPDSGDTCWSKPFVDDWEKSLPLRLQEDHPLWQRMLGFYRKAADRLGGKMLLRPLDLHTNMELLAAVRGPQRLCMDLLDQPEMIDAAMASARAIFPKVWDGIRIAGRMDEFGYYQDFYSMEGAACLQCDFSYMIGPDMFRRWVLPALEEEAALVKHALYHWDGPGALVHTDALVASRGLHTLSYTTGAGHGSHIDYLDLLLRVQAGGKAVSVGGTPDELKIMHRVLDPTKVQYWTSTSTVAEAEALLEWFVKHT